MTDALFWDIVGLLDWPQWGDKAEERTAADEGAVLEPAVRRLSRLPVREICLVDEFLHWRLYTLDTREHALHFAPGEACYGYADDDTPFSTDGFLYCRAMAVARGRREYEHVLADPTRMPREGFEAFLSLPREAYRRKAGGDYEYEVGITTWADCNKAGWMRGDSA